MLEEYIKISRLGGGSQGSVFHVKHIENGKEYALKLINCENIYCANRSLKEAKILSTLRHPNIVLYIDFFLDCDKNDKSSILVCLLMELCSHGDLSAKIQEVKRHFMQYGKIPLKEIDVLLWMSQAITAVDYIHKMGYFHRDIKPKNIFFSNEGVIKLGDFGLATLAPLSAVDLNKTTVGTPFYVSPELCLGERYGSKIDIWGLGASFLELITLNNTSLNNIIQENSADFGKNVGKSILDMGFSNGLVGLFSQMLQFDPLKRPNAAELLQFINELIRGLSISSPVFSSDNNLPDYSIPLKDKCTIAQTCRLSLPEHNTTLLNYDDLIQLVRKPDIIVKMPSQCDDLQTAVNIVADAQEKNSSEFFCGCIEIRQEKFIIQETIKICCNVVIVGMCGCEGSGINSFFVPSCTTLVFPHAGKSIFDFRGKDKYAGGGMSNVKIEAGAEAQSHMLAGSPKIGCASSIIVRGGQWVFNKCQVYQSFAGYGITVVGNTSFMSLSASILEGGGVCISTEGRASIENTKIVDSSKCGVLVKRASSVTINNSSVKGSHETGIHISEADSASIVDCECSANDGCGVIVQGVCSGENIIFKCNAITENRKAGVFLTDETCCTFTWNIISYNKKCGIEIKKNSNPFIHRNRISDSEETGIYVFENGRGVITDNEITNNNGAGLLVTNGGNPEVFNNIISHNAYEALWICNNGEGIYTKNDFRFNRKGAMDIDTQCDVVLSVQQTTINRHTIVTSWDNHNIKWPGAVTCYPRSAYKADSPKVKKLIYVFKRPHTPIPLPQNLIDNTSANKATLDVLSTERIHNGNPRGEKTSSDALIAVDSSVLQSVPVPRFMRKLPPAFFYNYINRRTVSSSKINGRQTLNESSPSSQKKENADMNKKVTVMTPFMGVITLDKYYPSLYVDKPSQLEEAASSVCGGSSVNFTGAALLRNHGLSKRSLQMYYDKNINNRVVLETATNKNEINMYHYASKLSNALQKEILYINDNKNSQNRAAGIISPSPPKSNISQFSSIYENENDEDKREGSPEVTSSTSDIAGASFSSFLCEESFPVKFKAVWICCCKAALLRYHTYNNNMNSGSNENNLYIVKRLTPLNAWESSGNADITRNDEHNDERSSAQKTMTVINTEVSTKIKMPCFHFIPLFSVRHRFQIIFQMQNLFAKELRPQLNLYFKCRAEARRRAKLLSLISINGNINNNVSNDGNDGSAVENGSNSTVAQVASSIGQELRMSFLLRIMETTHMFMMRIGAELQRQQESGIDNNNNNSGTKDNGRFSLKNKKITAHGDATVNCLDATHSVSVADSVLSAYEAQATNNNNALGSAISFRNEQEVDKKNNTNISANVKNNTVYDKDSDIDDDAEQHAQFLKFKEYIASTKDEFKLVHRNTSIFITAQPKEMDTDVVKLLPHQIEGLQFLVSLHTNNINGLLGDEMGVGKTLQTLALLMYLKEKRVQDLREIEKAVKKKIEVEGKIMRVKAKLEEQREREQKKISFEINSIKNNVDNQGHDDKENVDDLNRQDKKTSNDYNNDNLLLLLEHLETEKKSLLGIIHKKEATSFYGPHLVIAPLSIVKEWRDAMHQFVKYQQRPTWDDIYPKETSLKKDNRSRGVNINAQNEVHCEDNNNNIIIMGGDGNISCGYSSLDSNHINKGENKRESEQNESTRAKAATISSFSSSLDAATGLKRMRGDAFSLKEDFYTTNTFSSFNNKKNNNNNNSGISSYSLSSYFKTPSLFERQPYSGLRVVELTELIDCCKSGELRTSELDAEMNHYDVILLSLHLVIKLGHYLSGKSHLYYVIVDEAHKAVAHFHTQTAKMMRRIKSANRLVLTGTPLNNDLCELWSLLHYINPHIFADQDNFEEVFNSPFDSQVGNSIAVSLATTSEEERAQGGMGGKDKKLIPPKANSNNNDTRESEEDSISAPMTPTEAKEIFQKALIAKKRHILEVKKRIAKESALSEDEKKLLILRMHQILRPFMLRRTKKDIDSRLKITHHYVRCPLSTIQLRILKALRERNALPQLSFADRDNKGDNNTTSGNGDAGTIRAWRPSDDIDLNTVAQGSRSGQRSNNTKRRDRYTLDSDEENDGLVKNEDGVVITSAMRNERHQVFRYRKVSTITSSAQGVCNTPHMVPFMYQVVERWREAQIYSIVFEVKSDRLAKKKELARLIYKERKNKMRYIKYLETRARNLAAKQHSAAEVAKGENGGWAAESIDGDKNSLANEMLRMGGDIDSHIEKGKKQEDQKSESSNLQSESSIDVIKEQNINDIINKLEENNTCDEILNQQEEEVICANLSTTDSSVVAADTRTDNERAFDTLLAEEEDEISTRSNEVNEKAKALMLESLVKSSGKFVILDLLLTRLNEIGKKCVIFSHWLDCIDLVRELLELKGYVNELNFVILTGATSTEKRQEYVDLFRQTTNEDGTPHRTRIFLISMKAGGCGLNLQHSCHIIIMLDRDYTSTNESQAIGRVFRIGQRNTVRAIYLVTDDEAEQRIELISSAKDKPRAALIDEGGYNIYNINNSNTGIIDNNYNDDDNSVNGNKTLKNDDTYHSFIIASSDKNELTTTLITTTTASEDEEQTNQSKISDGYSSTNSNDSHAGRVRDSSLGSPSALHSLTEPSMTTVIDLTGDVPGKINKGTAKHVFDKILVAESDWDKRFLENNNDYSEEKSVVAEQLGEITSENCAVYKRLCASGASFVGLYDDDDDVNGGHDGARSGGKLGRGRAKGKAPSIEKKKQTEHLRSPRIFLEAFGECDAAVEADRI